MERVTVVERLIIYFQSKVQATYNVLSGEAKSKICITAIRASKICIVRVTVVERFIIVTLITVQNIIFIC